MSRRPLCRPAADRRGFTLIELLIALSLLAAIALALSGALGFGSRVWETGVQVADDAERLAATQAMLRRLLVQAAAPAEAGMARRAAALPLEGLRSELTFWAAVPPYLGLGGFYRFRLAVQERGGERDLVMTWRPIRAGAEAEESTVLLAGIDALAIEYLGEPDEGGRRIWQEGWEDADALPSLVAIGVTFPAGDRRFWPRLMIAPRLTP